MTATSPKPTDLPICRSISLRKRHGSLEGLLTWEIVLNTPPAKACVLAWKTEVISRLEMVNNESAPVGLRMFARKAMVGSISESKISMEH